METDRVLGLGTLVKADFAGGSSYETIACVQEVAPPDSERESVDGTCLDDDREVMLPGIPKATEFSFKALWRSGSDLFEDLKDAHDNKNDVAWQIIWPFETPKTEAFKGWIKKLGRAKAVNKDFLSVEVTVVTTTDGVIT